MDVNRRRDVPRPWIEWTLRTALRRTDPGLNTVPIEIPAGIFCVCQNLKTDSKLKCRRPAWTNHGEQKNGGHSQRTPERPVWVKSRGTVKRAMAGTEQGLETDARDQLTIDKGAASTEKELFSE